jgi:hypothetical protein
MDTPTTTTYNQHRKNYYQRTRNARLDHMVEYYLLHKEDIKRKRRERYARKKEEKRVAIQAETLN